MPKSDLHHGLLAATGSGLTSFFNPYTNQQQMFYIGTDQNVHMIYYTPSSQIWANQDMNAASGASVLAATGSALTSFFNPYTNQQQIFYIGTDQDVHMIYYTPGSQIWASQDMNAAGDSSVRAIVFYNISGQVTADGSALSGVTVSLSGTISATTTTDANGNYSFTVPAGGTYTVTPSLAEYSFSPASQTFSNLNGNQIANFLGHSPASSGGTAGDGSTPDPPAAPYPNYVPSPPVPSSSPGTNITGTWIDNGFLSGVWNLVQNGTTISGTLMTQYGSCPAVTWTTVTGSAVLGSPNVFAVTASNPSQTFDNCSNRYSATTVSATFTFINASYGSEQQTDTYPPASGLGTVSGTLSFWSATRPLYTISSDAAVAIPGATNNAMMIPMAITDTPSITTIEFLKDQHGNVSGGSLPVDVVYSTSLQANPHSNCDASLTIPEASGTGSATSNAVASSSSGCANGSGIFVFSGAVGGTTTQNAMEVVMPPQILIQVLYGEAHAQSARYGMSDLTERAIGIAIRNRFGDSVYFPGINTYQDAITPSSPWCKLKIVESKPATC